jgi:hypothetical protein
MSDSKECLVVLRALSAKGPRATILSTWAEIWRSGGARSGPFTFARTALQSSPRPLVCAARNSFDRINFAKRVVDLDNSYQPIYSSSPLTLRYVGNEIRDALQVAMASTHFAHATMTLRRQSAHELKNPPCSPSTEGHSLRSRWHLEANEI